MKLINYVFTIFLLMLFSNLNSFANVKCSLNLNVSQLQENLQNAEPIFSKVNINEKQTIMFPLYDGTEMEFTYESASLMHAEMQANYPEIKSYYLQAVKNTAIQARVNISPSGLFAIFKENGTITKISKNLNSTYQNDYVGSKIVDTYLNCEAIADQIPELDDYISNMQLKTATTNSCFENGEMLRTFRLAFSPTYEYVSFFGGTTTSVNAQIINDIASLSLIFETEMAISFQLAISNNILVDLIIAAGSNLNDPYSNPMNPGIGLTEGSTFIENNMPIADYDFGHSFHFNNGGSASGLAGVGVVCGNTSGGNFKSRGYSILRPAIFENYVLSAHEIGHMFSCRHTGYGCGTTNNCQRYEPGQGLTIMSTSAGCSVADDYADRTNYFGIGSIQSIIDFVENGDVLFNNTSCSPSSTSRGQCAITTLTGNSVPTANANPNNGNYTIPKGTPFLLIGEGIDSDSQNMLTYNWEEYDTDYSGSLIPDNAGNSGTTTDPLFRSFPPSTNNERICPQLGSILNGNVTTGTGEDLPDETRSMNWRFTVRDNFVGANAIACDEINIGVDASTGPFAITSQNGGSNVWAANGSNTATINWDVAGTNGGSVNCANVDIQFSNDGGNTFPFTLASATSNDGTHTITIPSYPTNIGRIRIICSDNIFFDINDSDIEITSSCAANGGNVSPTTSVSEDEGNSNLDLNLQPNFGTQLSSPISSSFSTSDPTYGIASIFSATGNCVTFTNQAVYNTYEFVVDVSGNYTFNISGSFGTNANFYVNSFDPNNACANIIHSGFNASISNFENNPTLSLTAGLTYIMVAQGFNTATNQPPIPSTYTITYSGPGSLFSGTPPPGSGFSYTYVVVDDSGNIIGFEQNSDLSNSNNYTGSINGSNYEVFGLSYQNGTNLTSYIGVSFLNFTNDLVLLNICGSLSTNKVDVTITGANACIATLNITGLINTGTYQADDFIVSNGQVINTSNGSVTFQAGAINDGSEYILLNSGFDADGTVNFTAINIDCNANDN